MSAVSLWAGFWKQSIECQLYFWILKSYQHGTRIGGERDSRPKHITAWTKNAVEKFCMRLRSFACVRLCCMRPHASASIRVFPHASAHRKLNVQTRLDTKNCCVQTRLVQGLSGCTITSCNVRQTEGIHMGCCLMKDLKVFLVMSI